MINNSQLALTETEKHIVFFKQEEFCKNKVLLHEQFVWPDLSLKNCHTS